MPDKKRTGFFMFPLLLPACSSPSEEERAVVEAFMCMNDVAEERVPSAHCSDFSQEKSELLTRVVADLFVSPSETSALSAKFTPGFVRLFQGSDGYGPLRARLSFILAAALESDPKNNAQKLQGAADKIKEIFAEMSSKSNLPKIYDEQIAAHLNTKTWYSSAQTSQWIAANQPRLKSLVFSTATAAQ